MTKKIKLNFKVDIDALAEITIVEHPVKVIITKPTSKHMKNYLGESGIKLAQAGIPFFFTKTLSEKLIKLGVMRTCTITDLNRETWGFWDNKGDKNYDNEKTGESPEELILKERKTVNKINMTKAECDALAKDKDKLKKAILAAEKPKGLQRYSPGNVADYTGGLEKDDKWGTWIHITAIKEVLKKRWDNIISFCDTKCQNRPGTIFPCAGCNRQMGKDLIKEIHLELTGAELK